MQDTRILNPYVVLERYHKKFTEYIIGQLKPSYFQTGFGLCFRVSLLRLVSARKYIHAFLMSCAQKSIPWFKNFWDVNILIYN